MIDKVDVQVVIYLDDIVVFRTNPRHVWEETSIVFERWAAARFMVNTALSKFLVSNLKMLGYKLCIGQC